MIGKGYVVMYILSSVNSQLSTQPFRQGEVQRVVSNWSFSMLYICCRSKRTAHGSLELLAKVLVSLPIVGFVCKPTWKDICHTLASFLISKEEQLRALLKLQQDKLTENIIPVKIDTVIK